VINATGVLLHTNLGRAPLSAAARGAVVAATGCTDVEYDVETGRRGRRSAGFPFRCSIRMTSAGFGRTALLYALLMAREDAAERPMMPQVGERIRAERQGRGLSLRALARNVGLSASLISQIETGKCQPSVSTLYTITTALGVSIEDIFGPVEGVPVEGVPAAADTTAVSAPAAAFAALASAAARHAGPLITPADRDVLVLDSGVTWERLGRVPGVRVDFLLVTYAPAT
jgi:transcriptional regulator with XRE-family HTH domain